MFICPSFDDFQVSKRLEELRQQYDKQHGKLVQSRESGQLVENWQKWWKAETFRQLRKIEAVVQKRGGLIFYSTCRSKLIKNFAQWSLFLVFVYLFDIGPLVVYYVCDLDSEESKLWSFDVYRLEFVVVFFLFFNLKLIWVAVLFLTVVKIKLFQNCWNFLMTILSDMIS